MFSNATRKLHHNFPDPAKAQGSPAQIAQEFAQVREQIKDYCRNLVV